MYSDIRTWRNRRVPSVDCSFERATIESWFCFAVEVVNCRFSGRLKRAVFNGAVPQDKQRDTGRVMNQFEGNDFSMASLVDVGFRTGIDLSKQRLPEGDDYTYLQDARMAVVNARIALDAWDDPAERSAALSVLTVMEEDVGGGQRQLLLRVDDYPRPIRSTIRSLLNAAQTH